MHTTVDRATRGFTRATRSTSRLRSPTTQDCGTLTVSATDSGDSDDSGGSSSATLPQNYYYYGAGFLFLLLATR